LLAAAEKKAAAAAPGEEAQTIKDVKEGEQKGEPAGPDVLAPAISPSSSPGHRQQRILSGLEAFRGARHALRFGKQRRQRDHVNRARRRTDFDAECMDKAGQDNAARWHRLHSAVNKRRDNLGLPQLPRMPELVARLRAGDRKEQREGRNGHGSPQLNNRSARRGGKDNSDSRSRSKSRGKGRGKGDHLSTSNHNGVRGAVDDGNGTAMPLDTMTAPSCLDGPSSMARTGIRSDNVYVSSQSEPADVGVPVASSAQARASGDAARAGPRAYRRREGDEVVLNLSQVGDGWFTDEDEDDEPPRATTSDIVSWSARVPDGDVGACDEGDGEGKDHYHESVV
jgi:hypothetical protein